MLIGKGSFRSTAPKDPAAARAALCLPVSGSRILGVFRKWGLIRPTVRATVSRRGYDKHCCYKGFDKAY